MAGKPSIKNLALKDARSGKTSKVRLQSIRLLIGRKLISPDEAERLIRALLETAKESYIRADCYELLEGLEADRQEDHRAEVDKLLAEEAARPVPPVVQKLDVEPQAPLAIAEAAKQRMGAGTAAAARRAVETLTKKSPAPSVVIETDHPTETAKPAREKEPLAVPAQDEKEASIAQAEEPVPKAPQATPVAQSPLWWSAWVDNVATGRGSGWDLDKAQELAILEERERKKARQRELDPYAGKVPLGSW